MTAVHKIKELYQNEVNWCCATFWDVGYNFSIGDELNGWKGDKTFDTFEEGIDWIYQTAIDLGLLE